MKYNELTLSKKKSRVRPGRGISAGRGKTAGRGTKGQGARKSSGLRPGFEGGQISLSMRLPHLRGFKTHKTPNEVVYTGELEKLRKSTVDNKALFEAGLLSSPYSEAKLLLKGELKAKKDVKLQAVSAAAEKALTKVGGSFTEVARQPRPAKKSDKQ